jgi:hypothetical protein
MGDSSAIRLADFERKIIFFAGPKETVRVSKLGEK